MYLHKKVGFQDSNDFSLHPEDPKPKSGNTHPTATLIKRRRIRVVTDCLVILSSIAILVLIGNHFHRYARSPEVVHITLRSTTDISSTKSHLKFSEKRASKPTKRVSPEVRHIAFLKVHKAASSTVQNVFFRFGCTRNLSFVLPKSGHYLSKSKDGYKPIFPSKLQSGKYDILCNHAAFNLEKFSQFMYSDAVYLAIVREPFSLLVSSAMYYRYIWNTPYLKIMNESTFISDLITNPEVHEPNPLTESRTFNYMSRDFGFSFSSIEAANNISTEDFDSFLTYIDEAFDFVLVFERFDESIIMLKRMLGWTTKDVIYIKNNARGSNLIRPINLNNKTISMFKRLNRFDYQIYELFLRRFDQKVKNERMLDEEVTSYRSILVKVDNYCKNGNNTHLRLEKTIWNDEFIVLREDCELMLLNELPFVDKLKKSYFTKK